MGRDKPHACGWPGCQVNVEAWQWGCMDHYLRLPHHMRHAIANTRHWWPEAKRARRAATTWAKNNVINKENE